MWDLPGPGLEPVPPALAGGRLTPAPPGKPYIFFFQCTVNTLSHSFKSAFYDLSGVNRLVINLFSNMQ